MGKKTPLYEAHVSMGARIVDFSGWEMPLRYGSQIDEHHQVRADAGMFDVSHMTILDLRGEAIRPFLRRLLANNVDRLQQPGKALYTCMLNEQGGVIDDLIAYFMDEKWFRLVVNAATHDKDLDWIRTQAAGFGASVEEPADQAIIAVQGPNSRARLMPVLDEELGQAVSELEPFTALYIHGVFISRTGYTGEDGFEIIVPAAQAIDLWQALHRQGVKPIGLAARDTLRLEAGMNLYGNDMDENCTPLESGLGWTVAWEPEDRRFIGREALERQRREKPEWKLVGLMLEGRGVLRGHQKVHVAGFGDGEITSGGFSPTLGKSIAFARVPAQVGGSCKVDIRGNLIPATIVKPPFVRHGKSCLAQ